MENSSHLRGGGGVGEEHISSFLFAKERRVGSMLGGLWPVACKNRVQEIRTTRLWPENG